MVYAVEISRLRRLYPYPYPYPRPRWPVYLFSSPRYRKSNHYRYRLYI